GFNQQQGPFAGPGERELCAQISPLASPPRLIGDNRGPPPGASAIRTAPPRSTRPPASAVLALFGVSGLAALIYQSICTHYLGLQLGHAAYAQTLVLAIFMGGMARGAQLASRWTPSRRPLLLTYAAVEGLIGLAGLLFHPLYLGWSGLAQ